jgi:septum formation protein
VLRPPLPIVLASASPRRQELLRSLIEDFEVVVSQVDEDAATVPDPWQTARSLALLKAKAVAKLRPSALVIGGDTVVALPAENGFLQLAKPADHAEAIAMLQTLSGKTHIVITGVAVVLPDGNEIVYDVDARVTFRRLSREEIEAYVATGEPMDKAGAYAVQAGGGTFIDRIEGERNAVIGLPTERLRQILEDVC